MEGMLWNTRAAFQEEGTVPAKWVGSAGRGLVEYPMAGAPKLSAAPFSGSDLSLSLACPVWCPQPS